MLGRNGRTKYKWSLEEPASVLAAKEIFESKLAEGYAALKIFQTQSIAKMQQPQTVLGEQIRDFDSRAKTIQMTPPMVGG